MIGLIVLHALHQYDVRQLARLTLAQRDELRAMHALLRQGGVLQDAPISLSLVPR